MDAGVRKPGAPGGCGNGSVFRMSRLQFTTPVHYLTQKSKTRTHTRTHAQTSSCTARLTEGVIGAEREKKLTRAKGGKKSERKGKTAAAMATVHGDRGYHRRNVKHFYSGVQRS